jgi:hypothetical protein
LCLICGVVSGNLEAVDFDLAGEVFEPWRQLIHEAAPDLLARLVIERSPSGGWHAYYRGATPVSGSTKLAQRKHPTPNGDPIVIAGKRYEPRQDAAGVWHVMLTLIETKGQGGLILCAPTPGYELTQGQFTDLPVVTEAERDLLLESAASLNEHWSEPVDCPAPASTSSTGLRPGDDFSRRGDVRALLQKHSWTLVKPGENEYWRRPGKTSCWSATLKNNVFYVHTTNAAPFEGQRAYSPFAVYTLLEHHGDWAAAAAALRASGYGAALDESSVDLTALLGTAAPDDEPAEPAPEDPGPLPVELLRVPGFISEVLDYCLKTAPYPNQTMAFCGALALQSLLAARKVRDPGDNRTNIYVLALAHSAAGKDRPRKVNTQILYEADLADCLGERFASGEGVQDALFLNPAMLFQTDEIDGMLQSINKAKDARHENIMSTLLTMYSSANSIFPMRRKAGLESPGVIDQPCLTIFGTAIPNHYYEALSERMLTNGFFARTIIVESGPRAPGQEPSCSPLPPRVLATARWWAAFRPGKQRGNLADIHPEPLVVEHTDAARKYLIETRQAAEAEYAKAEAAGDSVSTTVWGRTSEQTRKLALLYAVSENYEMPQIGLTAVQWASRFIMHHTRRMLFMARGHVADNPFHAECLKAIEKLRDAPGHELRHQVLLKRMKMSAKDFRDLIQTLITQGDVGESLVTTGGRTGVVYRLLTR